MPATLNRSNDATHRPQEETPVESEHRPPRFLMSLLVFAAVGFFLAQFAEQLANKYEYPIHSWSWWTVQNIKQNHSAPNTVLIGSSLMVVANAECDATYFQKRFDLTTYRKARYLDHVSGRSSINLASPGQIPSDAYLTMKAALQEGVQPNLVIYGVAPRDFFDSTLDTPYDTECYRYMTRLVSAQELEPNLNDAPVQSLTRNFSSLLPLSSQAVDLQMHISNTVSQWNDQFLNKQLSIKSIPLEKRMLLLSNYEPLDMVPGFINAEVAQRADVERLYQDNLLDYVARYRKPKMSFYDGQMACLEMLMDLCEKNKIRLVVVNMPIRECNWNLLAPELRKRYLDDLARVCGEKKIEFRNLCNFAEYSKSDFRDSVHLNGFGGKKFIDQLVLGERGLLARAPYLTKTDAPCRFDARKSFVSDFGFR